MHDFKAKQVCIECECPEYILFVNEQGQGIRCLDCGHERVVVTPQTKAHKKRYRVRMVENWAAKAKKRAF